MTHLESKPLNEVPGFYKNPSGFSQFGNLGNDVKKDYDMTLSKAYPTSADNLTNIADKTSNALS